MFYFLTIIFGSTAPMFLKEKGHVQHGMMRNMESGGSCLLVKLLRNDPKLLAPILEYLDQLGGLRVDSPRISDT